MKKPFITICATALSLFLSQCSENPAVSESPDDSSKSIKIAIAIPPGLDTTVSSAYVEVSAEGMDTIRQTLSISYSTIGGIVQNVPAGYNRHFEVYVYGSNGKKLMYYGDSYANIYSGQETYIKIILRQPGGTAVIHGYIEEYYTPYDRIPAPSTPYIYDYQLSQTTPPRCNSISLATEGSYYYDSLLYYWEISRITNLDSSYEASLTGMVKTLEFPKDGYYSVSVKARNMYGDTIFYSPKSNTFSFTIKNGLLTDSIIVADTASPIITLNGPDSIKLPLYSPYIEYGANAYDMVDGDLTDSIKIYGYIDSTKAGTYTISYTVSDNSGNTATTYRTIFYSRNVPNKDTIPPVITLLGPLSMNIAPGDSFSEPGYTAYDNVDGNITSKVKTSRQNFEDIIRIIYTVRDASGNMTSVFRVINTMPPLNVIE